MACPTGPPATSPTTSSINCGTLFFSTFGLISNCKEISVAL
jgi:hypothetical protein